MMTDRRDHDGRYPANIRTIQRYMGHTDLETTMVYLHLTQKGQEDAYQLIDTVMGGLDHGHAQ
jgi:integrase